jgi:processive 1,2-diacylglycerol beta-glucosyltransferase
MANRILVLSASVGAGHLRAAQAVELALKELDPSATVRNMDVLELTNGAFRRVYAQLYLDLVNNAPHVLGYFYERWDKKPASKLGDKLRYYWENLNLRKFRKFLKKEHWDLVVNTHFLPAEMIAASRKGKKRQQPQVTVTTDFETHRLWVNQPCDHYFTATEEGALNLAHWGIPAETITVTGIPIHPSFHRLPERQNCLTKHGLRGDRSVLLQLAGGFGVGPIKELFEAVLSIETPIELIVVTGRNEKLKRKLEKCDVPDRHRVHILGFTTEMHELMVAADLVMTKPGGLTTSEAIACGAAMVVVNPIPGQESRNSDFLLENGAAIKINNVSTLPYKLGQLLADPARIAELKRNARRLGKPDAAFRIARFALDWGKEPICRAS